MGKLTAVIQGKLVFFDSVPAIYFVEQNPVYSRATEDLFVAFDEARARGITSVLTLVEVLTKPFRDKREDLASEYRSILMEAVGILLLPIDDVVCERAARLRADHRGLRTPDALQVATALVHGADLIVTNDARWKQLTEIQVILLSDFAD